ncbi:MAG: hypothetical protein A2600_03060 [Candidatus Lambdaproteobacteria bacterium RIFOXYD1_FULL_56_27]|uniref:Uncharacterized protein n=1 Tax=Candidatus Lambdaproteobacteria bacterium RIFOXYD2_FULL_56_26 TaxID=1817773 RepID=A0A1F6H2X9_9PROT|nr:MAG: hypothetical protein A2557_07125 [Candidatus Lambdaproteobacteria bacterium RIFOXYD2_FULL_56_26]OGH05372.1 MAG: hypothetical protein A2426_05450 [Candidatus Lambdaproteobacteria bacterium RIFOXYC1_FULL_56_13]OGH09216.1 MAG: hypothetical protein A2600_03060 [Candidatus Lambdaproteobacteria bacterium RIFOXYD1_FULL_56_27]
MGGIPLLLPVCFAPPLQSCKGGFAPFTPSRWPLELSLFLGKKKGALVGPLWDYSASAAGFGRLARWAR